jgi:hypothetical protein
MRAAKNMIAEALTETKAKGEPGRIYRDLFTMAVQHGENNAHAGSLVAI